MNDTGIEELSIPNTAKIRIIIPQQKKEINSTFFFLKK